MSESMDWRESLRKEIKGWPRKEIGLAELRPGMTLLAQQEGQLTTGEGAWPVRFQAGEALVVIKAPDAGGEVMLRRVEEGEGFFDGKTLRLKLMKVSPPPPWDGRLEKIAMGVSLIEQMIERSQSEKGQGSNDSSNEFELDFEFDLRQARAMAVAQLIANGGVNREIQGRGWAPLHEAAYFGEIERAQALLVAGARLDARSSRDETPLMLAIEAGQTKMVRLLARRMSVEQWSAKDKNGCQALERAIRAKEESVVGAEIGEATRLETLQALLSLMPEPETLTKEMGEKALARAAMIGWEAGLQALLDRGVDPRASLALSREGDTESRTLLDELDAIEKRELIKPNPGIRMRLLKASGALEGVAASSDLSGCAKAALDGDPDAFGRWSAATPGFAHKRSEWAWGLAKEAAQRSAEEGNPEAPGFEPARQLARVLDESWPAKDRELAVEVFIRRLIETNPRWARLNGEGKACLVEPAKASLEKGFQDLVSGGRMSRMTLTRLLAEPRGSMPKDRMRAARDRLAKPEEETRDRSMPKRGL